MVEFKSSLQAFRLSFLFVVGGRRRVAVNA